MSLPNARQPITAILLAGSRPGADPLADAAGVRFKTLMPVAGVAMINHVARTLAGHPRIGRLLVLVQQPDLFAADPQTAWLAQAPKVEMRVSGEGISQSLLDLIDSGEVRFPALVTTADNILLSPTMIDQFLDEAAGSDLSVALVERRTLLSRYPESRRTWLKLRGGWWSGANLFWLGGAQVRPVVAFWRGVEQDRKKGRKILGAFGPFLLVGTALRLFTLAQALRLAGRRFGVTARAVAMAEPEACIDADKPEDIVLIERILTGRA